MTKPSTILVCPVVPLRQLPPADVKTPEKRGAKVKHGCSIKGKKTRTYKIWNGMVARCHVESATGYERYGGQGIKVCERWRDFSNFLADMGEAPEGMSIDRKDSSGDYEPSNCRWATRQTQNENRSSVRWIEVDGISMTAAAWAKKLGLSKSSFYERLEKWPLRQALGLEPRPPQVRIPPVISVEGRKRIGEANKRRSARKDAP